MLDPRIYRTGFVAVALALVVAAFSLTDQQGALGTTLAPDAFNGQDAYSLMVSLARGSPQRGPGSIGDDALAGSVAQLLGATRGFNVSSTASPAVTADGPRTIETVSAIRAGLTSGVIVVLAHRDARATPAIAGMSGTAVLVELARVLAGETLHRTIMLVSTSSSAGAAGAVSVARSLTGQPVDAVLALGDLAGNRIEEPILVPWSSSTAVAPTQLRNTVAAALGAQSGLRPGGTAVAGQLARLAFPMTLSEQGPFGDLGQPSVLLSLAGERGPAPHEPVAGSPRITALGRAVLQSVSALDGGPELGAPASYLLFAGKVVPEWAVRLLVLALCFPVLMLTVDGLARARRRGHSVLRGLEWVLSAAIPFALCAMAVLGAHALGWISVAPPAAVVGGVIPLHIAGVLVMGGALLILVIAFGALRLLGPLGSRHGGDGGPAAVLIVLCLAALVTWAVNPFTALLLVPALHLWPWIADPQRRPPRPIAGALALVGLIAPALVIVYYLGAFDVSIGQLPWSGALLIAGGAVAPLALLQWSVLLGCTVVISWIALLAPRAPRRRPEDEPVTVRGPVTYAGPGSLGGTESALRR
ncbi:MAG: hypothetical protein ACYC91_12610 [Solirubrobacteraceae bacterium]